MTRSITTLSILLVIGTLNAQNFNGKYIRNKNVPQENYINFNNDHADFVIDSEGCLIFEMRGNGTYEIIENYLVIHTEDSRNSKSSFETSLSHSSYSIIKVMSNSGENIPGANISLINNQGNVIGNVYTDFYNGEAKINDNKEISKIKISCVGYSSITIDFDKKLDYQVFLSEGVTLEHKTLVFKITSVSTDSLCLTLLSTDFKSKKNINKAFRRLERKAKKYHPAERIYKKLK